MRADIEQRAGTVQHPQRPSREAQLGAVVERARHVDRAAPRAEAGRHGAQSGHRELASDDHDDDPRRDLVDRQQRDERGGDEQLVGDGVE